MTDKEKRYWAYFLNVNGKIEYYEQCKKCVRSCKQSFRITKLFCKKYQEAYLEVLAVVLKKLLKRTSGN